MGTNTHAKKFTHEDICTHVHSHTNRGKVGMRIKCWYTNQSEAWSWTKNLFYSRNIYFSKRKWEKPSSSSGPQMAEDDDDNDDVKVIEM